MKLETITAFSSSRQYNWWHQFVLWWCGVNPSWEAYHWVNHVRDFLRSSRSVVFRRRSVSAARLVLNKALQFSCPLDDFDKTFLSVAMFLYVRILPAIVVYYDWDLANGYSLHSWMKICKKIPTWYNLRILYQQFK